VIEDITKIQFSGYRVVGNINLILLRIVNLMILNDDIFFHFGLLIFLIFLEKIQLHLIITQYYTKMLEVNNYYKSFAYIIINI